jgi:hypothetical protein
MSTTDYLYHGLTKWGRFVRAVLWRIRHAWTALVYGDCEYF